MKTNSLGVPEVLMHFLLLPLLPIAVVALFIMWIFRQAVGLWLYLILGDKFGGLLASTDKIYAPTDKTRKLVISVNYMRSDEAIDLQAKLRSVLAEKVFIPENPYPKLTATRHCFLGHDYWTKNQVTIDDVINTIPLPEEEGVKFDDEYIKGIAGRMSNSPLPKNDCALWELHVSSIPLVDYNSNVKGCIYPGIVRVHHTVMDGARLVAFFGTIFTNGFDNYHDKLTFTNNQLNNGLLNYLINTARHILYLLYIILITLGTHFNITYFKKYEKNFIHGSPLSGKKLMAWSVEGETRCVPMIKRIKSRVANARFSELVFTCIAAAIFNFFKKHNQQPPEQMPCLIPILLNAPSIDTSKPVELKNDFTMALLDMPLVNPSHFLEGLEAMKASMDQTKKNPSLIIFYLLTKYASGVLPSGLLKVMHNSRAYGSIISVVPGTGRVKAFGEYDLLACMSSAPHTHQTGLTITVVTYDDKFHICLLADKALIPEQADVQYIGDEILRNMEILDKETSRLC